MNDVDRFLQAIRESPYDDDLRLVFADWLEDQGDPRGELMHLEVELARLPEDDPQRDDLQQASFRLQEQHAEEWVGPLREKVEWSFPRGLLHLAARAEDFFPLMDQAAHMSPWIERVQLSRMSPNDCDRLRDLERLPNLTTLDLSHNHLGVETAFALVHLNLPFLAELCLWNNALREDGYAVLVAVGRFKHLKVLDLSSNQLNWLGPELEMPSLGNAFPRLETLDLRGNPIFDEAIRNLGWSEPREQLRKLYLGHCQLTEQGAMHLAAAPYLSGLQVLMLAGNRINPGGVSAIVGSDKLPSLERLYLGNNPLGREGAVRLAASDTWRRLQALSLFGCRIGDLGLVAQAEAGPTRLTFLDLAENGIGPAGIAALARSSLAANLTKLDLAGNVIGDAGAQELAESPHLSNLRRLDVQDNDLTDVGASVLANSPHLENLRVLNVGRNPIRRAGQAALRDRFGERVQW
jgi:uncharacterized protein (TIGR02996 family)